MRLPSWMKLRFITFHSEIDAPMLVCLHDFDDRSILACAIT